MKERSSSLWKQSTLEDIADFQNGGAWKESEYSEAGITVVRVTNCKAGTVDLSDRKFLPFNLLQKYQKHGLKEGDLVVATVGSHPTQPNSVVGRASVVPRSADGALLNQNAVRLRAKNGIYDQRLLCQLAQTIQFKQYIAAHARGAASQVRMSIELLRKMPVLIPPRNIQHRIASILSAYDDLIENNTRRIGILEELARRLYEEWFVHFRFPGHELERFKETEHGKIPERWVLRSLYDVAEVTYGHPFKAKDFNERNEGVGAIRIRDIRDGNIKTFTTEQGKPKHLVENGDILVGMDGQFHMGKWAGGQAWLVQRVARFKPTKDLGKYFLFLSTEKPIKHLEQTIVGTTVAHLSTKDLQAMQLLIPSKNTLEVFNSVVEPMYDFEIRLRRKNANLRTQRDLLLPKLVSGELDVSDFPLADLKEEKAA